jgi:TetR/AcrR family transcriptional repressor of lmrAB and yxaGH operons
VGGFIDLAFARTRSAEGAMRWFFDRSVQLMLEQDFDFGCPVATVALERAVLNDAVARACADALTDWVERFTAGFRADRLEARPAKRLAGVTLSQYEGALLLSRVQRTVEPLRNAGAVIMRLIADAR